MTGFGNIRVVFLLTLFAGLVNSLQGQGSDPVVSEGKLAIASLSFVRTDGMPHVEMTDLVIIETSKRVHDRAVTWNTARYAFIPADASGQPLDTILIEDPLNPKFEYSEDQVTIRSVVLPRQENHILVRFPYTKEMRQMHFADITGTHALRIMHSLPLRDMKE